MQNAPALVLVKLLYLGLYTQLPSASIIFYASDYNFGVQLENVL